ncbi:hypothetical protein [Streptomyces afghaniensis]|uniref:hypothetical protein n=1 Tax=Streptomyces afghaniensis TaxID=66865 RepID=UPI0027877778|nr:hypothetical protein [Streptomyces afghaniensis]MDQ1015810.1 hypothetical protein [Streptomyces afghaniensis]
MTLDAFTIATTPDVGGPMDCWWMPCQDRAAEDASSKIGRTYDHEPVNNRRLDHSLELVVRALRTVTS